MAGPRLDHVAFGAPDVALPAAVLRGELGGEPRGSGPGGAFVFWQWEFENGAAIEVIAPDGPPGGFLHRFLDARGPAPHHVTFKVPDIHAALERARGLGYEPVGFDDRGPGWIEAFLHPKQAQGIVVQLAQSAPEDEQVARDVPRPPFPETSVAPERARVVGLRLAARSEERAIRQWQTLLSGTLRRERRDLVFHWPESPLRIAVTVQGDAPEGPIALEVAARRRLALPEGPHPALGLPLVQVEAAAA